MTINHLTTLPLDRVTEIVRILFEKDSHLQKLDPDIRCQVSSSQKEIEVSGSRFEAHVRLQPRDSGTQVCIVVDLPLLLSPFKGKVEETIREKLSKYLV